jgi:hypothetical protein
MKALIVIIDTDSDELAELVAGAIECDGFEVDTEDGEYIQVFPSAEPVTDSRALALLAYQEQGSRDQDLRGAEDGETRA